jgi:hypothetical protein
MAKRMALTRGCPNLVISSFAERSSRQTASPPPAAISCTHFKVARPGSNSGASSFLSARVQDADHTEVSGSPLGAKAITMSAC